MVVDSRVDELRRRLERDPGSRLFAQLAEELRKAGEIQEAVEVARTGLETHPSYASARLTLGRALLDSGDAAGARVELETAVRGAPDNILASRLLGEALEALGDIGSALDQYRRTLEIAPGDRHVEARLRAIQQRLEGAPSAPSGGQGPPPEVTKPMPAVRPERAAELPRAAAGRGDLPPAVPPQMPTEGRVEPRAPLPPTSGGAGAERTPRFGALAEPLPPTLPLGQVVSPEGPQGPEGSTTADPRGKGAEAGVEAGLGTDTADVGEAAQEVAEVSGEDAETTQGRTGPGMSPASTGESVPVTVASPDAQPPLSSATLAELYFQQGLLERAVEVYLQVLEEEPGNEGARRRHAEIEKMVKESAAGLPAPAPGDGDDRVARRRALQGAIERLEALLVLVRRR